MTTPTTTTSTAAPAPASSFDAARVAALEDAAATARASREKQEAAVADAAAALQKAQADAGAADQAHNAAPSDATLTAALAAAAAVDDATAKLATAREGLRRAASAEASANVRLADARTEARKVELRKTAALQSFYDEARPHMISVAVAANELREHAQAVDEARDKANAAAAELRKLGEPQTSIDVIHLVAGFLMDQVARLPPSARSIVLGADEIRYALTPDPDGMRGKVLEGALLGTVDRINAVAAKLQAPPEAVADFAAYFDALLSGRSRHDGRAAVEDEKYRRGDHAEINRRRVAGLPPPADFTPQEAARAGASRVPPITNSPRGVRR